MTNRVDQGVPGVPGRRTFRLRPAIGVRMVGVACIWLAAYVMVGALRGGVTALDNGLVTAVWWVLLAVFVVTAALGAAALAYAAVVVGPTGLVNRMPGAVGVRRAAWPDVTDVRTTSTDLGPVLVVRLANKRETRIPLARLNARGSDVEEALREHANSAWGYRPLADA